MDLVVEEVKQLYPSLTNQRISVSYGKGNITELMKSVILHDIENDFEVKNAENR